MTKLQEPNYGNCGIGPATQVPRLRRMWRRLVDASIADKCSIRVFDGNLYSLMDDEGYYENSGNRKLINCLLYTWDGIRNLALKDEKEQGWDARIIERTEEEQEKINHLAQCLDAELMELNAKQKF